MRYYGIIKDITKYKPIKGHTITSFKRKEKDGKFKDYTRVTTQKVVDDTNIINKGNNLEFKIWWNKYPSEIHEF